MSEPEFEAKYGFQRPLKSDNFGLHCMRGKRATDAADKLMLLGYDSVKIYKGSFLDWKSAGGQVHKEGLPGQDRFHDFHTVRKGLEDKSFTLIDVRTLQERQESGFIPGSRHVPKEEVWQAFGQLSVEDFEAKYGFAR